MDRESFTADAAGTVEECLENIQTTSVDGRTYASIEDILGYVHVMLDTCDEILNKALVADALGDPHAAVIAERAHATGLNYAVFDHIFHALDDKEGLESLSPGDFL